MLLWLADYLSSYMSALHVFQYLTLRGVLSIITALALSLLLGPWMVRQLNAYQIGQTIRDIGPATHLQKSGTPTMGGLLIIATTFLTVLLWADLNNRYVWLVMAAMLVFGVIGLADDYRNVIEKSARGLPARWKYLWQSVGGLVIALWLYHYANHTVDTQLFFPFLKDYVWELGPFFILLTYCVIVGASNAVNLTDGLDGLAIMPVVMIGGALGIIVYLTGHASFSQYLLIPYIPDSGELVVFCGALAGAGLGFLWFNTYPAQVFMGDVGSLALGASLGTVAVISRHEIVFFIMGGIFVVETLSVILQVAVFKLTGKRIFRMAPIHHHFELKGWPEPRVIVRFWIISGMLVLFGLATLKLR